MIDIGIFLHLIKQKPRYKPKVCTENLMKATDKAVEKQYGYVYICRISIHAHRARVSCFSRQARHPHTFFLQTLTGCVL